MEAVEEGTKLVITVTPDEQKHLQSLISEDGFDSDDMMYDILEPLVTNDTYTWIDPSLTGDLTDAPMLAILGEEQPGEEICGRFAGCWPDTTGTSQNWYQPILKRWAFMDYQIISPQRRLAETGRCVFVSE